MSDCGETDLCPVARGDTWPFIFEFFGLENEPLPLKDMRLHFVLWLDPKQERPDLHHVLHFDRNSRENNAGEEFHKVLLDPDGKKTGDGTFAFDFMTGKGTMKVLPSETRNLRAGQCYFFAFQLEGGPEDIYTVGSGKVPIKQDAPIPRFPLGGRP